MIIGLSGYAQSGKDEVAKILVEKYGYQRLAFADAIRDLLYESNPIVNELASGIKHAVDQRGWDEIKKVPAVRTLLQNTGVAARTVLGDDVWVIAVLRKIEKLRYNYVISDVRFENEATMIRKCGGEIWRVKRPGIEAVNGHVSETEMDHYKVDRILHNGGSLGELESLVQTRMDTLLHANKTD